LAVFKSTRYIYAQLIDDERGVTLAQANSRETEIRGRVESGTKTKAAARVVGEVLAERARQQGVDSVVFDRGGYRYHGRLKELAEGARAKGLKF
jgi:large subunit ribosomal protein L18